MPPLSSKAANVRTTIALSFHTQLKDLIEPARSFTFFEHPDRN
jgi:hypothetical protein